MPNDISLVKSVLQRASAAFEIQQITYLPQGVSNRNYRIDGRLNGELRVCLVKIYSRPLPLEAIAAQRALAEQGVCPPPLYVDDSQRCAVFDYAPGCLPSAFNCAQAVACLRKVHQYQVPVETPVLDLHFELAQYQNKRFYQPFAEPLQQVITDTKAQATDLCFCHNDLIKENIISHQQQWQFIDFEYAQRGDKYFDLAQLAMSFELSTEQGEHLLKCYFGELNDAMKRKFAAMQQLVAALNYFWYEQNQVTERAAKAKIQLLKKLAPTKR